MLQLFSKYLSRQFEIADLEEVVTLLTDSYKTMNPVLNQDWIAEDTLKIEFRSQIINKVYSNGFVLVERSTKQIIACGFISPLKQFQVDMKTDLTQIPTRKDVMRYLRDAVILRCLEAIELDTEKSCVGSLLAVNSQYAGQGICVLMFYQLALLARQCGFQQVLGNVTNEKIKFVIRKYLSYETYGMTNLNEVFVIEGSEKPFDNQNITQEGGFFNVKETIVKVEDMLKLEQPQPQPITLQLSRL